MVALKQSQVHDIVHSHPSSARLGISELERKGGNLKIIILLVSQAPFHGLSDTPGPSDPLIVSITRIRSSNAAPIHSKSHNGRGSSSKQ